MNAEELAKFCKVEQPANPLYGTGTVSMNADQFNRFVEVCKGYISLKAELEEMKDRAKASRGIDMDWGAKILSAKEYGRAMEAERDTLKAENSRLREAIGDALTAMENDEIFKCACGWKGTAKEAHWQKDYESDDGEYQCPVTTNGTHPNDISPILDALEADEILKSALAPSAPTVEGEG